ncbi:MAG TPA: PAS domain S-box protein, partial [Candidatus Eisenbacteria bacterium]|nr:PAS domain S-box protein [Candidatus Eisenbacteria bacterium]
MTERWDEEDELRSVTLENARSIQARRRAEEELLRAQDELRNQSEWFRVTLASIGDAVITTDTDGNVISLNSAAEQLTGWSIQDAKGRPLGQVFRIVNEDTRARVENPTERALREGRIVGLANHTILIARNGHETPIDDSAAPIRDESNRVHGVILIFRSISERKEAEEALRQSERELSDFFENASVAMHWVGSDGIILRVNRAELNMLGYDLEEYVGHPISEFHVDKDVIDDLLARLAAGETVQDCEARMRCKDGSIKHVLIDSSVRWVAGKFVHTRCFTRDITDRKQAELARARLAAIVESSQDAIISKTLEGRIVSWNTGAEHTFGYRAEEAIGRSIMILIPEERHDEERVILERIRRGQRIEHYETVRIAKDGRRVAVSLTISPVRDDSGRIIGVSKISRDITARKKAEQRLATQNIVTRYLAESESLESAAPLILQAICENQTWQVGALWCLDDEAQVLRFVDLYHEPSIEVPEFEALSRGTTFKKGEGLPGRIWAENQVACIPDISRDNNFPRALAARAGGLQAGFGFPITLRNDVLGVVEFFSSETRQPSQHLLTMMAAIGSQIGQFIERRRAERARAALLATLKETDRRKDEFLAMLAHELRNPLAPIHNAVQIYRRVASPSRDLQSATEVIDRQVRQLTRLVDDLLDVSRITRGKVELRKEPLELSDVLQSALEASRPLIEKNEHALTIDISGQPIRLNADPTRLAQVFLNLLNNAAKYTAPGGHIFLAAKRNGDEVVVRVKDNGIGIP